MRVPTLTLTVVTILNFMSEGVNGESKYLYSNDPDKPGDRSVSIEDVSPVKEYIAPSKKAAESDVEYKFNKMHPDFLEKNFNRSRVVEFYAPWCGHCIHFKKKYIEVARKVNAVKEVPFYAISCVAHKPICNEQGVSGYPAIKWFDGHSAKGETIKISDFSAEDIIDNKVGAAYNAMTKHDTFAKTENGGGQIVSSISHLQAISDEYHQKNVDWDSEVYVGETAQSKMIDMWKDAALSFDVTMRESVFMSNDELSEGKAAALRSLLSLLTKTMPVTMDNVKNVAATMLENFDEVVKSQEGLEKHLGPKKEREWSSNCSHGEESGYNCGVWHLMHIITVGVPQWNIATDDADLRVSTTDAGEVLKDFIYNFFPCEECRKNFVAMYQNCKFNRCERFHLDTSHKKVGDWKELPIWLWEVHNDISVRIMSEKRRANGHSIPGSHDEQRARWPPEDECEKCWRFGGKWEHKAVYRYLRKHYWSEEHLGEADLTGLLDGPEEPEEEDIVAQMKEKIRVAEEKKKAEALLAEAEKEEVAEVEKKEETAIEEEEEKKEKEETIAEKEDEKKEKPTGGLRATFSPGTKGDNIGTKVKKVNLARASAKKEDLLPEAGATSGTKTIPMLCGLVMALVGFMYYRTTRARNCNNPYKK